MRDIGLYITSETAVPDSLNNNQLCGVTFTILGITALCEGLKQSKVSSLRCVSQLLSMCDIGQCHTV